MKLKKTIYKVLLILLLLVCFGTSSNALDTYYKKEFKEKLINGVEYQKDIYLTNIGWLNIHVLKVDYSKDYIDILPVYSEREEYGKRDILTNLLNSVQNSIAGINADFFSMANNTSYFVGTLINQGKLVGTSNINEGYNNYASIFLDKGSPFIDFFDVSMKFYINNEFVYDIKHLNKITNFDVPVVINDPSIIQDTQKIDSLYKNLYKVVIQNNNIVYVSQKGETVKVPNNGYIIVMKEDAFNSKKALLTIGQATALNIKTSINPSNIDFAISGSVKILENGRVINQGVPNTGRNPRTAIGITKDKKHIIMLCIDGRTQNSVGLTHEELADIMLSYGAYEALNFDGGGSTTMALKSEDGGFKVVNQLSDGAQRKIINGLAVVNNSKVSETKELKIKLLQNSYGTNYEIPLEVIGYDEYGNISTPDASKIKWSFSGVKGKISENKFIAQGTGKVKLTATYGKLKNQVELVIENILSKLKFTNDAIIIENGKTQKLELIGLNQNGNQMSINSKDIKWTLSSKTLGSIKSGSFKAGSKYEKGYITASYLGKSASIPVIVGVRTEVFDSFDNENELIEFASEPETIVGDVKYNSSKTKVKGKAIELSYSFGKSNTEQTVRVDFNETLIINERIKGLGIDVYGDRSNNTLSIDITDGEGNTQRLVLAQKINWTGYKNINVNLSEDLNYPISIDSINVTSAKVTSAYKTPKKLYFDNIYVQKEDTIYDINLPKNNTNEELSKIENNKNDKAFNLLVLDKFDLYNKERQDNFIKNINSSYNIILNMDRSNVVNKSVKKRDIQNENINIAVTNKDVDIIYLVNEDKNMFNFLEYNLLQSKNKNFIIITNQVNGNGDSNSNKQILLQSIIDEAGSAGKNILVISNSQKQEVIEGNIAYLPINYDSEDYKSVKIKIISGKMSYGWVN